MYSFTLFCFQQESFWVGLDKVPFPLFFALSNFPTTDLAQPQSYKFLLEVVKSPISSL